MNSKHTPGPWEAGKAYKHDANSWFAVVFAPAKTGKYHAPRAAEALGIDKDETTANAQLIAAAPDYDRGARECVQWLDLIKQNYPDMAGLIRGLEKLKSAIAKAEGV